MDDLTQPGNIKAPTGLKQIVKIPRLRTISKIPIGPRVLHQPVEYIGGPGKPPPGFVVGQTSASEWNLYWAYAKAFQDPPDPRKPPFVGGKDWGYQVSYLGAYRRAPGSAVVDYILYLGNIRVGVRLQTIRFHYLTNAYKQEYDFTQQFQLMRLTRVYDVQEEDVLGDPTGSKYIITAKKSMNLIDVVNPIIAGVDPRRQFKF